uniref:Uncharacterized protein n=1 Tax=Setaria viridis TaxID=4556 RepID=A0A4U6VTC4_SETVI|nr:hypothetical protein SEVIR_2G176700v2 [Setaria viridis]
MGRQIVSSRMFEDIGRNYGYFPDPTNLYVVKCKMCVKDARSIALQAARIRRPYDNYLYPVSCYGLELLNITFIFSNFQIIDGILFSFS